MQTAAVLARKIYLLEDEASLADVLVRYLESSGYEVTAFSRGDRVLDKILEDPPDLAILDLMVPGMDGLEVLREIRNRGNLPVIFISARKTEFDRILGIELGADDYLTKPFSVRELVARIRALLRRAHDQVLCEPTPGPVIETRHLTLDLDRRLLSRGRASVELTSSEFALLARMMRCPGRVYPRAELCEGLAAEGAPDSRALDMHMRNLRKKVRSLGVAVELLQSVRGVGYRLED